MTFKIKLHPKVNKFLSKLDDILSDRIKDKLILLKENPFMYLKHFEGEDFFKFRVGDYRALIDIDIKNNLILVRVIEHRSKIYKRNFK